MDWTTLLAGRDLPLLMGIVNVTPDSFSDGGKFFDADDAVGHGLRLVEEGADILDVGGESTRPAVYGEAEVVPADEEIRRTAPVIERLAARVPVPIAIDTRKGPVARAALSAGAAVVNDVTALRFDPETASAAASAGAAVVLMHMRGTDPRTMQRAIPARDPSAGIAADLTEAVRRAEEAGIAPDAIAIDPGIGFGKTAEQNLRLVANLAYLSPLGRPIVLGASRKGFLARFSGLPPDAPASGRLAGSLACIAAAPGAAVVRVHDVAATAAFLAAVRAGAEPAAAARSAGADGASYERMAAALRAARIDA